MDNELFELCKEVYEKTGWSDTDWVIDHAGFKRASYGTMRGTDQFPLYTSDYLLEKLPHSITVKDYPDEYYLILHIGETDANAAYEYNHFTVMSGYADTPLKALLKLTLALHEAGEL